MFVSVVVFFSEEEKKKRQVVGFLFSSYRAEILRVLQVRFDRRVVDTGIQNSAQIAHYMFLGVQENRRHL